MGAEPHQAVGAALLEASEALGQATIPLTSCAGDHAPSPVTQREVLWPGAERNSLYQRTGGACLCGRSAPPTGHPPPHSLSPPGYPLRGPHA